ncbi:chromosomal replication initiator protein DnaA [Acidipila sp. EB88]|uniref:chromosomal replication initiator protein DnaA n=1 Tax=Acidipila sp. EB88 TaxID=2305226 RepID=UPI000F5E3730|nr:chromosomal replication initiator protein DnaA [Acidipila sp. EB88]RRA48358.1 chromosomal replication initiator protein DnaA [Acidipila sp. EB88]
MSFYPVSPAAPLNPWVRILGALQKKINRQAYETWFKPTLFSHTDGNVLIVRVPSAKFQGIGDRYADLIGEALDTLRLPFERVDFVVPEKAAEPAKLEAGDEERFPPAPVQARRDLGNGPDSTEALTSVSARAGVPQGAQQGSPQQGRFDWNSAAQLNPKYTFDAFVGGTGNQFARAAAAAVAESPAKAYNPLFLYGGVGVGKTHLMQAIGHEMKRRQPNATICYVSSEKFTNEMINSLRYDKMTSFRDKYRSVDLLLIDDIQFLTEKERTQEEFFHTFNALHESLKQIVIASDRSPKEIKIEDRLRSRFEWGLIADIQPPDLETRVAILHKKAESEESLLPTDVALFVASNVRTNVRELEGALTRLLAWCKLHGVEISLTTAQLCLKQFIDTQVRKITIEAIQRAVASHFAMKGITELKERNNSRKVVVPRQIAMYLAKQMTEASLPEIGRQFGNKHHTTVMHSIGKIEDQRRSDKELNRTLAALQEELAT